MYESPRLSILVSIFPRVQDLRALVRSALGFGRTGFLPPFSFTVFAPSLNPILSQRNDIISTMAVLV